MERTMDAGDGNWVLSSSQRAVARWMLDHAALLGVRGLGRVEPNPMVGCVIAKTLRDGEEPPADMRELILGTGHHKVFGGRHAEAESIIDAQRRGHDVRGATAYVTLEPCNSTGRNPACVDGLLAAGISRVVYARKDPHPIGPASKAGGAKRLMDAGVKVAMAQISRAAVDLGEGFITRFERARREGNAARPYTIVKWAQSLDGRMMTASGASQWITGPVARRYAHRLRGACDVVLTSSRVVLDDDAQMDARGVVAGRIATRVVLDVQGQLLAEITRRQAAGTPAHRMVQSLQTGEGGPVVVCADTSALGDEARAGAAMLQELGGHVVDGCECMRPGGDKGAHFGLACVLRKIRTGAWWQRDELTVAQVMVEAGPRMTSSLLQAGLADEAWVFIAPKLLGGQGAMGPMEQLKLAHPREAQTWRCVLRKVCGEDQLLVLRPHKEPKG
jgi:diaminohydroxyphosphoribosylaminopyrimidine deaminase / 5-amino-6-(5-phosphoribosylamino)uracil reductase